jgi:hypothetical protein
MQQMEVRGTPSADQPVAWDDVRKIGVPTVGWFVRQSALWAGIVAIAVTLACALYSVAGDAGAGHGPVQGPDVAKITNPPIRT